MDPAQFAFVGKTVLKLSNRAIQDNSATDLIAQTNEDPLPKRFSEPLLTAMTRLVEIVAELRSPMGGWPSHLPKTSENLIPYVLEEAYDVIDALKKSPENLSIASEKAEGNPQEAIGNPQKPVNILGGEENLIVVDELLPRLLWNVVRSSYDVMQLIGGVPAQVVRSGENARSGLVRLVVGLAVSSTDRPWFVDLATHNAGSDRGDSDFCPADALIHCPDVTLCHEPISARDLLAQLRQEMAFASPELAQFMEPKPVEWLHPCSQWLSGLLQLTMDLEFVAQADPQDAAQGRVEREEPEIANISGFLDPYPTLLNSIVRLSQPSMLQDSAKTAIGQALILLLPQIQQIARESVNSAEAIDSTISMLAVDDAESPKAITRIVRTAYEILEEWEFPWGEGEVAIDECLHRLLWQTITSSYPVMQSIGSVEAMVLVPGEDWEIGILRLLALFEIKTETGDTTITVDLSTGQPLETNRLLDPKTIVRSPNTELCRHPVTVQHLLNTFTQQIQTVTPTFQWLINGAKIDLLDPEGNWESGSGQFHLDFEFIIA